MSKRRRKKAKSARKRQPRPRSSEERPRRFTWIPLWGWVLIFLLPLLASEFMFYRAGRWLSMILFPIAWIGFWVTMMHRSGWVILKRRKDR